MDSINNVKNKSIVANLAGLLALCVVLSMQCTGTDRADTDYGLSEGSCSVAFAFASVLLRLSFLPLLQRCDNMQRLRSMQPPRAVRLPIRVYRGGLRQANVALR